MTRRNFLNHDFWLRFQVIWLQLKHTVTERLQQFKSQHLHLGRVLERVPGKRSPPKVPQRGPPAPAAENCRASTWVSSDFLWRLCHRVIHRPQSYSKDFCSVPKYLFLGLYVFLRLQSQSVLDRFGALPQAQPTTATPATEQPQAVWKTENPCTFSVVLGRMNVM